MSDRKRALQLLKSASENAVSEGMAAVSVTVTNGTETVTFNDFAGDVDPRIAAIWLLGGRIQWQAKSVQAAGGELTMEQAARDAIAFVREHGDAEEAGI